MNRGRPLLLSSFGLLSSRRQSYVNSASTLTALEPSGIVTIETICTGSSRERRKDDREANRADTSEPTSKEPENYFWVGRSAHGSVNCWVCSVLWSHNSSFDNDHVAADFQGPESTPKYCQTLLFVTRTFLPYIPIAPAVFMPLHYYYYCKVLHTNTGCG